MELPVACTLSPSARSVREDTIRSLLSGAEAHELPNGLRLEFDGSPEWLRQIAELATVERECCPFLRFEVVAEPDLGPIRLTITGPAGTGAFLRSWIEA